MVKKKNTRVFIGTGKRRYTIFKTFVTQFRYIYVYMNILIDRYIDK